MTPRTMSAPSNAAARSEVTSIRFDKTNPPRKTSFSRLTRMRSARSGSQTHSRTDSARGSRVIARAVPQLPPPMMASLTLVAQASRPAALNDYQRQAWRPDLPPLEHVLGPRAQPLDVLLVPHDDESARQNRSHN